jgi:hypothetical protein
VRNKQNKWKRGSEINKKKKRRQCGRYEKEKFVLLSDSTKVGNVREPKKHRAIVQLLHLKGTTKPPQNCAGRQSCNLNVTIMINR